MFVSAEAMHDFGVRSRRAVRNHCANAGLPAGVGMTLFDVFLRLRVFC